jgi:hypothetical protein
VRRTHRPVCRSSEPLAGQIVGRENVAAYRPCIADISATALGGFTAPRAAAEAPAQTRPTWRLQCEPLNPKPQAGTRTISAERSMHLEAEANILQTKPCASIHSVKGMHIACRAHVGHRLLTKPQESSKADTCCRTTSARRQIRRRVREQSRNYIEGGAGAHLSCRCAKRCSQASGTTHTGL